MKKAQVEKLYYFSPLAAAKFGYTFAKNKKLEDIFFTAIVSHEKDYGFPDKILVGSFKDNELSIIEQVPPEQPSQPQKKIKK